VKESDRIAALATELAKIGVRVESPVAGDDDAMTVTPPEGGVDCSPGAPPVAFATYDDHRIAMALALVALKRPGVTIVDPACVGKTYPRYWDDFARLF
jgi:3-phosphoshikimate 1-carboxyvinyltransferase